jgi:copper transport protein
VRRAVRLFGAVIVAVSAVLFAAPSAASAHAVLVYSVPAASSVLPSAPDQLMLDFDEDVEAGLSSIRLFDADQKEVEIGRTELSGGNASVVVADLPRLGNGTYVVVWRVTSADGHPVNGAFPFEIGTVSIGTGGDLVASVVAAAQEKSPLGIPIGAARFVAFLGVMLIIGTVSVTWGTRFLGSPRAHRVMLAGLLLTLLGTIAHFALQGAWVTGGGWSDVLSWSSWGDVASSRLGAALLVRLVLALVWAAWVRGPRRSDWDSVTSTIAVVLSVLTVLTFSISGHAAAGTSAWLWAPVDAVHMLAAGAWAGGLLVLAAVMRGMGDDASPVVSRFSRTAGRAMPVVVATGLAQGLHLMGGTDGITGTDYGRYWLGKIAVVAVITVFAVRARRMVRAGMADRMSSVVRLEAALVAVVLVLTAGLVATSPRALTSKVESHSVTLVEQGILADIAVTPPRTGTSEIHVVLSPPGGAVTPVSKVAVRMELPSRGLPMIPVTMTEIGANHWTGVVQLLFPGEWNLEVLVTPEENRQVRYATVVPVKG